MSNSQLSDYPIFSGLSQSDLAKITQCLSRRSLKKGAYLYKIEDAAVNFYLVESGLLRLFFTDASGQEYLLELVGPGAILGMPLLYEDHVRTLSAAAVVPSVVLALSQRDLAAFSQRFPRLMQNIYQYLFINIRKLINFIQTLVILGVEGRLVNLILHLSSVKIDQTIRDEFEVPVSQAELARWLGTSRGHLNRSLIHLQELGLIRMEGQKLTILDRKGLQAVVEDKIAK